MIVKDSDTNLVKVTYHDYDDDFLNFNTTIATQYWATLFPRMYNYLEWFPFLFFFNQFVFVIGKKKRPDCLLQRLVD
jgi:hypothetical protein